VDDETPTSPNDVAVLTRVLEELNRLDADQRKRVLQTIATFYQVSLKEEHSSAHGTARIDSVTTFGEDKSLSPKDFLWQKQPKTAIERVACLAYYLTHYRDTPFFKTADINRLNTEAAQMRFSNPPMAVNDAGKTGYLVAAEKGRKQLSAMGEQFVRVLPDREAARLVASSSRRKRKKKSREDSE
jgi:hypothetical protein